MGNQPFLMHKIQYLKYCIGYKQCLKRNLLGSKKVPDITRIASTDKFNFFSSISIQFDFLKYKRNKKCRFDFTQNGNT